MKKFLLLVCACVLVMACNSGGGGSGGGPQELDVEVSGTFGSGRFVATSDMSATLGYADPAAVNTFALQGKLEDSVIFDLAGTYNSETGVFTLSAASSTRVYAITGSLDETGAAQEAEVTISEDTGGGNWQQNTQQVTLGQITPITGTASAQVNGLPAAWTGTWKAIIEGENYIFVLSPFIQYGNGGGDEWIEFIIPPVAESAGKYTAITFDPSMPSGSQYLKYTFQELSETKLAVEEYDMQASLAAAQGDNQVEFSYEITR
ncbi:MAG: hypothetical protein LBV04_06230 [Deferribacteraceae bacterium]|nr:hypothetical protein [Deferribacteraceae bacterium]